MQNTKNLIHISDDEKFVDNTYWQFEKVYPGQNKFYILVDDLKKELKYVTKRNSFTIVDKKNYKTISDLIDENAIVFIHNLEEYKSRIVLEATKKITFIWMFYGVEYFSFFDSGKLYGPISSKYRFQWFKTFLKRKFEKPFLFFHLLKNGKRHPRILIQKAIKKISFFGIIHEEDFALINDKLKANLKHFKFSYYPLEFISKNLKEVKKDSNNILLGNSSFLSNNHFEALQILSKLNLKEKKILCPLSYGDSSYAKEVIKAGKLQFNNAFIPILDFMPLEDYNNLIRSCSVAIFNNYRQQAIGNTVATIWMGAKVYLDERNTFYQFLKRKGVHVFSVKKDLTNKSALFPLTQEEIAINRKILSQELSAEVLLNYLHQQIEAISS